MFYQKHTKHILKYHLVTAGPRSRLYEPDREGIIASCSMLPSRLMFTKFVTVSVAVSKLLLLTGARRCSCPRCIAPIAPVLKAALRDRSASCLILCHAVVTYGINGVA